MKPKAKLCQCGCGEFAPLAKWTDKRRNHVRGYPLRFILGHHGRLQFKGPFYKINKNGCWKWQAFKTHEGYGLKKESGRSMHAHRYMYLKHRGKIPNGLHLDHLCRVRDCVNPDHLEIVTVAENNRRSSLAKINHRQAKEIKIIASKGKLSQKEIGGIYGIGQVQVSNIKRGKSWA